MKNAIPFLQFHLPSTWDSNLICTSFAFSSSCFPLPEVASPLTLNSYFPLFLSAPSSFPQCFLRVVCGISLKDMACMKFFYNINCNNATVAPALLCTARLSFQDFDLQDVGQPLGGMITTSGWSAKEDYDLSYIYCSLSLDPVRGADQSGETFWGKVTNAYNRKNMDRNRSVASVKGRYCKINRQTQCFDSQMYKLKQSNPSGFGNDTHMRIAANKLFKQIYKPDSKQGPHFYQFMHVYDLLVNHVKWKSSLQKTVQEVQSSSSRGKASRFADSSSPGESQQSFAVGVEEDATPVDDRYVRPEGSKAAKKRIVAGSNDGEIKKLLKESNDMYLSALQTRSIQHQEKINAMNELVEVKRRKEEDLVMFADISQMDDMQREYMESRRIEIMRRRRGEGSGM